MAQLARRPSPFGELVGFPSRFDQLFDQLLGDGEAARVPAVDIIDEDDAIVVRADVPGLAPEEVKIDVKDDVLTIRGEHEEEREDKDKRYLRRERRYGAFARSMALPAGVDPDEIRATCKNGVVEVRIPHPRESKPKTITVESGS